METCKKCSSKDTHKFGFARGKQRYKCRSCGISFTLGDRRNLRAKPLHIKNIAIQLYQLGLGFRAIGKFLNVSNVSVLYWVRKAAEQIPTIENPLSIRVMAIDEMWHYCQKKEKYGSGCQFVVITNEFLSLNCDAEV